MNENTQNSDVDYPVRFPQDSPYDGVEGEGSGDFITLPDGRRIAPNGDVIRDPNSAVPEILPDHDFTSEKEDLDLLIM